MVMALDRESAQTYTLAALADDRTRDLILSTSISSEWFVGEYVALADIIIKDHRNWQFDCGMNYKHAVMAVNNCISHVSNYDYWLSQLWTCHKHDRIGIISAEIGDRVQRGESYDDLIGMIVELEVDPVAQSREENEGYFEAYSDAFYTSRKVLSTGYTNIDANMPICKGEYVIIAGRPSAGKTSFLVGCLLNFAKQGKRVLYYSLDDPYYLTVEKLVCINFNVDQQTLRNKANSGRVKKSFEIINDLPLTIASQRLIDLDKIIADIRKQKKENPDLEVVAIDHMTKIRAKGGSAYERTTKITSDIFALTKELGITIFVLSQLSREGEKNGRKEIRMSDLRDTGAIEQDATKIIAFYLPEDRPDKAMEWIVCCDIIKSKSTRLGKFDLQFTGPTYTFKELE